VCVWERDRDREIDKVTTYPLTCDFLYYIVYAHARRTERDLWGDARKLCVYKLTTRATASWIKGSPGKTRLVLSDNTHSAAVQDSAPENPRPYALRVYNKHTHKRVYIYIYIILSEKRFPGKRTGLFFVVRLCITAAAVESWRLCPLRYHSHALNRVWHDEITKC